MSTDNTQTHCQTPWTLEEPATSSNMKWALRYLRWAANHVPPDGVVINWGNLQEILKDLLNSASTTLPTATTTTTTTS